MDASIIIVHYGDFKPTKQCIKSVFKTSPKGLKFEVIVVDNNPDNSLKKFFKRIKPEVIYIKSDKNNYCRALNIGIKKAKAKFVVLLNPDTVVDKNWLAEIINPLKKNKKIAGVSSKILFKKTKKINSMGIKSMGDFYYVDSDFNFENSPDIKQTAIKGASGCSVAYRKSALEEITKKGESSPFDEDFVMYYEDVEIGLRLRKKAWKLVVNPKSIVFHEFHGTSKKSHDIPWVFCNRNRFLLIAKHFPNDFARQIKKSHPYINKQFEYLYDFIKAGLIKLFKEQNEAVIRKVFPLIIKEIADIYPLDKVQNIINYIELYFGLRKPRICFYDHAMHFIGGGQKYGLTIAEAVKNIGDITLVANKPVTIKQLENWYSLNLKGCKLKTIQLAINKKDKMIDPRLALNADKNPFAPVEDEVLNYDLFINVNMVPAVNALALKNIFLCHFPDIEKKNFFYPPKYDCLISNSKYTAGWIEKRWGLKSDMMIYPPIDMVHKHKKSPISGIKTKANADQKENIILSVSRFEISGSKKQLEMVKIFCSLYKKHPKILKGWKLVLCGGSIEKNKYLMRVKNFVKSCGCPIEIVTNISNEELKNLYAKSKIFWHACGLNEDSGKNPVLIEHFGMTTVEAMQNGCVPITIDGGGQKEIVKNGKNGFRFRNEREMKKRTIRLIKNGKLMIKLSLAAAQTGEKYSKEKFQQTFKKLISSMLQKITCTKNHVPEVENVIKDTKNYKNFVS